MSGQRRPTQSALVLGVDGGGTKTEAVFMDACGRVLAAGTGGPSNRNFVPQEVVDKSVRDAVDEALRGLAAGTLSIALVGACVAGRTAILERVLADLGYHGEILYYDEPDVVFERAGIKESYGIAAVAGTGSSFWGRDAEGRSLLIGGWGPIAGEEGSAFDIGLQGIRAAGRAIDGRGQQTILLQRALNHFGAADFGEILARHCRPAVDQRAIAGFAKVVTASAIEGDQVAKRITAAAAESLASDIAFVASRLFQPDDEFPIVLTGGVFSAGEIITRPVTAAVNARFPRARVRLPRIGPGEAVARLTLRRSEHLSS